MFRRKGRVCAAALLLIAFSIAAGYICASRAPSVLADGGESAAQALAERSERIGAGWTLQRTLIYEQCGHEETVEDRLSAADVGATQEQFAARHISWQIRSFGDGKVAVQQRCSGYCPQHVILRVHGGALIIERCAQGSDAMQEIRRFADFDASQLSELQYETLIYGKVFASQEDAIRYVRSELLHNPSTHDIIEP